MESNEPITTDELNSELTGLNKGQKEQKKKQLILGIAAGSFLALIIIIIIIIASSSSSKKRTKKGEINLIYDVKSTFRPTQILGDDFKKESSDFDIIIDEKQ